MIFLSALLGAFLGAFAWRIAEYFYFKWMWKRSMRKQIDRIEKAFMSFESGFGRLARDLMKDDTEERRH